MRFYLLLLIFFLNSCVNQSEKKIIDGNESKVVINDATVDVAVSTISMHHFMSKLLLNGKIVTNQKNDLFFRINEKITKLNIENGQKINKNQKLASLENSLLRNNVEKAKIELRKVENKLSEEKINYGQENITLDIINKLKIKNGFLEAINKLERAQIEYEQTILKAPFSGVIANLEKKEGDFITTSDVLCTLINPDNLEVSFSVLENEFQFVFKGQDVEIHSFVNKGEFLKGTITEINPLVDKNGLIKIKAKVLSKKTNLLDGMNVKIFINKSLKDVIVIPKEALVLRSNRQVVFTLEKGLAKWNYVEVAGENNNSYAIKKGLKVSDTIIVSDNLNLSHDAKVNTTFIDKEINIK
ncbi:efflux RND transporter periplasmic adaptor subunit [Polaribacter sp. Hel_I_88]|uniref:efflux RND transporter periplasmic adaptor subunit n=1 Tax=Polaribacter sp. Hel_I_88 TaxID=1250006 RepID=UPI00047B120B|nr:efflux RND transporter periplasmic adaptor subunit [Polaribacter sp. Hel_I_88]